MAYKQDLPKLRECPFCGSEDVHYYSLGAEHQIDCHNCPISVFFDVDLSPEEAIALWNKRTTKPGVCWVCGGKDGQHTPNCDTHLYREA